MTSPDDKKKDEPKASAGLKFGRGLKSLSDKKTGSALGSSADKKAALRSRVPAGAPTGSRTLLLGTKPLKDVPKASTLHKKPAGAAPPPRVGARTQLGMAPVKLPIPRTENDNTPNKSSKDKPKPKMSLEQRLAATIQREIMNEMAQSASESKKKETNTYSDTAPADDPAPPPPEFESVSSRDAVTGEEPSTDHTDSEKKATPEDRGEKEPSGGDSADFPEKTSDDRASPDQNGTEEDENEDEPVNDAPADEDGNEDKNEDDEGDAHEDDQDDEGEDEDDENEDDEGDEDDEEDDEDEAVTRRRSLREDGGKPFSKFDPSPWKDAEKDISKGRVRALWVMATILLASAISVLIFLALNDGEFISARQSRNSAKTSAMAVAPVPPKATKASPSKPSAPPASPAADPVNPNPSAAPADISPPAGPAKGERDPETRKKPVSSMSKEVTKVTKSSKKPTPSAPPKAVSSPVVTVASAGEPVTIRVNGLQRGATVQVDGKNSPRVFTVPQSDKALKVEATLEGYASMVRRIVPTRDKNIRMHLKKEE